MKMVCAYCGCKRFIGHQLVRMDVVVDEDNAFIEQHGESPVYDSETPYGPYTCEDCGAEFDVVNDRFEVTQAPEILVPAEDGKMASIELTTDGTKVYPVDGDLSIQGGGISREEFRAVLNGSKKSPWVKMNPIEE